MPVLSADEHALVLSSSFGAREQAAAATHQQENCPANACTCDLTGLPEAVVEPPPRQQWQPLDQSAGLVRCARPGPEGADPG